MQRHRRHLPDWLKISVPFSNAIRTVETIVRDGTLNTVCVHAKCPNRAECFGRGTLTFMILGDTCTRNCAYCNVTPGIPGSIDHDEPEKISRAAADLNLKYVVITSVTRDDLPDFGAGQFAQTVYKIRDWCPDARIELLVPDFRNAEASLDVITRAVPDVIGHNIETVRRLFPVIRKQADYQRSLSVLEYFGAKSSNGTVIKSGLMIGLGETVSEIRATFTDLLKVNVTAITIGQYLAPSAAHFRVQKYYTPDEFENLKKEALAAGFDHVESGPFVRSSYYAERTSCR